MAEKIEMWKGDVQPIIRKALLRQRDGTVVDLQDAVRVDFRAKDPASGDLIIDDKECEIIDAGNGEIRYFWDEEDTEQVGKFKSWFIVRFPNGDDLHVPNKDYTPFNVNEE